VTFSKTSGVIRKGPPRPGEDNDTILAEAGFSGEEIAALREERLI